MDPGRPHAEAIAISGSEIAALGDNRTVRDHKGPATRVIDAGRASVVPGFVESHMHLFFGGSELSDLHIGATRGFDALKAAVQRYAAANPSLPVVMCQGADHTLLGDTPITRRQLDAIISDRPLAMMGADHHTMWANTKALDAAGLLHGRKLGPGNEIVMGPDGLATGELREPEAYRAVLELAGTSRANLGMVTGGEPDPPPTPGQRSNDVRLMQRGLDWCAKHGITSIHNMDGNLYQLELLSDIEQQRGLDCRVQIPFHFKNFMDLGMLDKAAAMRARYKSEWLKSGMIKVFYDGVIESWTAVMLEPYADRPDWTGEPLFSPEQFRDFAVAADRLGFQIAVHAIGDGAVRAVLDGYEAARAANGPRDSRHRIEHIEVISAPDVSRVADLGVIASLQPPHAPGAMDFALEPSVARIGSARLPLSYAWRTLKNAGARVAFSSDWPVARIDPIAGMQAAARRKPFAAGLPEQSFPLLDSLAAYTYEGAYAEFMEHRKGSLRPGYLADIAVLSDNIETIGIDALDQVRVVTTVCGGRVTYQA